MFPRIFGDELSHKMLEEGYKLSAQEALSKNTVCKIVNSQYSAESQAEDVDLVAAAEEHVRKYLDLHDGRRRSITERKILGQVNAEESLALANAFVSDKFLCAMIKNSERRSNIKGKLVFQALRFSRPIWSLFL